MRNAIRTITRVNKAIVMERLGLTAVVAGLSSFRSSAVQVPEYTPPGVKEARRFTQCDVLLPPNLIEESLGSLLSPHV